MTRKSFKLIIKAAPVIRLLLLLLISHTVNASQQVSNGRALKELIRPEQQLLEDLAQIAVIAYNPPDQVIGAYNQSSKGQKIDVKGLQSFKTPFLTRIYALPIFYYNNDNKAALYVYRYQMNATSPKYAIISFRGSDGVKSYISDGELRQSPFYPENPTFAGFSCYHGFNEFFNSTLNVTDLEVNKAKKEGLPIIMTGHSLGGATSGLAAAYYVGGYANNISYVGFGTPRFPNVPFADYITKNLPQFIRVWNGKDCVPKVAPITFKNYTYKHAGAEYHIGVPDPNIYDFDLKDAYYHDQQQYVDNLKNSTNVYKNITESTLTYDQIQKFASGNGLALAPAQIAAQNQIPAFGPTISTLSEQIPQQIAPYNNLPKASLGHLLQIDNVVLILILFLVGVVHNIV